MRYLVLVGLLFLVGCGLDESLFRSDTPTSPEKARKDVSFPFPSSAKDVYYVVHSGGMQEFELYIRFTVDPKELDKVVNDIFADYDNKMRAHNSYKTVPVEQAPRMEQDGFLASKLAPGPWWNTDSITNGYYRSPTNKFLNVGIWVDISQHTIFFRDTD
jgi:hypothetical protein